MKGRKSDSLPWYKLVKNEFISFLSETTIPGFNNIVDGRTIIERCAWAILLPLAFFLTGTIINKQWMHWRDNPVETTFDEVGLPVDILKFPAITVCDTESLKMPRKNRWMFVEKLLNSLELEHPEKEIKGIYPGI